MKVTVILVFIVTYLLLILLGIKQFILWDQVASLIGKQPLDLLFGGHPHALRFILVYPVIFINNFIQVDINLLFSLYVFGIILFTAYLMSKLIVLLSDNDEVIVLPWFFVFFLVLSVISFFMNGRLMFAFAGILLLVYTQIRWLKEDSSILFYALRIATSLMLMSVSSGTFVVGFLICLIYTVVMPSLLLIRNGGSIPNKNVKQLLFGFFLVIISIPVLIIFIKKNLLYFGGGVEGFYNMLSHGPGKVMAYLGSMETIAIVLILFFILIPTVYWISCGLVNNNKNILLLVPIICAGTIGVFGYSTLLVGFPIIIVMVSLFLQRFSIVVNNGIPAIKWVDST